MDCIVCGQRIPEGARACPQCGTLITASNTQTNISSKNPTITPSAYNQDRQAGALPPYAVDPYSTPNIPPTVRSSPSSPSYNSYNTPGTPLPYNMTEQIPPPPPDIALPPARPPKKRIGLIISMAILIVILVGGGSLLLVHRNPPGPSQDQLNATATAATTQKVQASATAAQITAAKNPYGAGVNTLILKDTLQDNSKGYKWDKATMYGNKNKGGVDVCGFKGGAYHVTREQIGALLCSPEAPELTLSNLAFEANLNLIQGDYPGIVFRLNQAQGTGYLLDIDTQGGYDIFLMNLNAKNNQDEYKSLHGGSNGAIKKGLKQSNLLAIVANGSTLTIYINNQYIDTVQDKTYSSGQIGFYVYGANASDLMVNSARVWKL